MATALVATPERAGAADIGDGLLACTNGEICFKKHVDTNWESLLKHFWNSDRDHNDNYWSGTSDDVVGEAASMYWNRDTQCDVYVLDYHPLGLPTYTYTMGQGAYTWYINFPSAWNDENDGHARCTP